MSIRRATFSDINGIMDLLHDAYDRSIYRGKTEIDEREARALVMRSMQRHGGANEGSTWVAVSEWDGKIQGLILGVLSRVYNIGIHLSCTDIFWVCTEDVPPTDPWKLYNSMLKWAGKNPKVIEIVPGVTGAMMDYERSGKIFVRHGFEPFGTIYRKENRA